MTTAGKPSNIYSRIGRPALDLLFGLQIVTLASLSTAEPDSGVMIALRFCVGITAAGMIAVNNRSLLYYVRAISARNDDKHHRPTAIALSLAVFITLIAAYAAIYIVEMPVELATATQGYDFPSGLHQVVASLYFSTITISTLGYGDITPQGELARTTAAAEALNGLIAFGVFTGVVTSFMATRAVEAPLEHDLKEDGEKAQSDG